MKATLITILLFTEFVANASTIEVCADCPTEKIGDAINMAENGDTILVREGFYAEQQLLIDKSIVLKGEGEAVISSSDGSGILLIQADGVTIEGLTLTGVQTSYIEDRAAIRMRNCSDFKVVGNRVENTFFGIYIENSNHGIVDNNFVSGAAVEEMSSGNAMHAWHCVGVTISNNHLTGHRDGIYLEFVDSSNIFGNVSEYNIRYGLHFMFSNDDNYHNNEFRDNGAGVAVMFSRRINMKYNHFVHNWGRASYGLLLKEIYDAQIEQNNFEHNTIGIQVEGSSRIQYLNNDFRGNGWAIKIMGGTTEDVFRYNNFLSNSLDFVIKGGGSGLIIEKNFWSEYSGYDLDHDGIGDVPHRPVKLYGFILEQSPESIVLLRSMFIGLVNFSEKVSPVFTPVNIYDESPLTHVIEHSIPKVKRNADKPAKLPQTND